MPAELIKGNEEIRHETTANFVGRMYKSWQVAQSRLFESVQQQAKWYDARHRPMSYKEGDLVLLSTTNLQFKGIPTKLRRKFVGPFRITECIGHRVTVLIYLRLGVCTMFSCVITEILP